MIQAPTNTNAAVPATNCSDVPCTDVMTASAIAPKKYVISILLIASDRKLNSDRMANSPKPAATEKSTFDSTDKTANVKMLNIDAVVVSSLSRYRR